MRGQNPLVYYPLNKPLSIAVEEVYKGEVKILPDTGEEEQTEAAVSVADETVTEE